MDRRSDPRPIQHGDIGELYAHRVSTRKKICWEKTRVRVVALYESWDAAEPGKGYAEKAAQWRAKLAASQ